MAWFIFVWLVPDGTRHLVSLTTLIRFAHRPVAECHATKADRLSDGQAGETNKARFSWLASGQGGHFACELFS